MADRISLERVAGAVGLATGVLTRDPTQLAAQLIGRLSGLGSPGLAPLLDRARAYRRTPWLCPLTPCLSPPGQTIRHILGGHGAYINAVATAPGGELILSAANDGSIRVWEATTGRQLQRLTLHPDYDALLRYSQSEGPWLLDAWEAVAVARRGELAFGVRKHGGLAIWDLGSGLAVTPDEAASRVTAMAITPCGRWALIGAGRDLTLWDLERGAPVGSGAGPAGGILAAVRTPHGMLALSATGEGPALLWSFESGQVLATLVHEQMVLGACFTPDGRLVITGAWDHRLRIWEVDRGVELGSLPLDHESPVAPLAVSPDGKLLAVGSAKGAILLYTLPYSEPVHGLRGHSDEVSCLAFLSDGRLVSGSHDATVRIWDFSSEKAAAHATRSGHEGRVNALVFAGEGRHAVSAGDDATLRVWDLQDRTRPREQRELRGHDGPVTVLAPVGSSARVLSGSTDHSLRLWDLGGRTMAVLSGHGAEVTAVAVSPDGRLAASGALDNTLRLWDLASGRQLAALELRSQVRGGATWFGGIGGLAFTADGQRLICACHDREVRVLDLARGGWAGALRAGVPVGRRDHFQKVTALTLSPDAGTAFTVGADETFRLWDLANPQADQPRRYGHGSSVVVPMTAGRDVVTAGSDGSIRVRDGKSWSVRASLDTDSSVTALAVAPDGETVAFGEIGGAVHFLRLSELEGQRPARRRRSTRQPAGPNSSRPRVKGSDPCPCGSGKKYSRCHGARH